MATQMTAVRKALASTSCLMLLAPLFAITGYLYTFVFLTGPLAGFPAPQRHLLQFDHQKAEHTFANGTDEWSMQTELFSSNEFQAYPYVSNGYFGQTLPAEGLGYWVQQNRSTTKGTPSLNSLSSTLLLK